MSRAKVIALSVVAIVLPVALGFTAYFISLRTIGSAGTVPGSDVPRVAPVTQTPGATSGSHKDEKAGTVRSPTPLVTTSSTDDHGGKCSEPEHSSDPSCADGESGDSGNSGPGGGGDDSGSNSGSSGGSGGSDSDDSGNSGPGGDD